jgi:putative ABC transport system permease protein
MAIASALGAKSRQLSSFVWSEAGLVLAGGLITGLLLGWGVAHMLIKLLTQVFDPPPQSAVVPWAYIVLVLVVTIVAVAITSRLMISRSRKEVLEMIRRL